MKNQENPQSNNFMKKLSLITFFIFVSFASLLSVKSDNKKTKKLSQKDSTELQGIYKLCQNIQGDLAYKQTLSEDNYESSGYTKSQQISALNQNLKYWISEYNKKTSKINQNEWNYATPYELSFDDFKSKDKE